MNKSQEYIKNLKIISPKDNRFYLDIEYNWNCSKPNIMLAFTFPVTGNRSEAVLTSPYYATKRLGIASVLTDEEKGLAADIAINLTPTKMKIFRKYKNARKCEVVYFLFPDENNLT
jgi:hypothetical protein